jgi:2-aminoadipate transaminase
MRTHWKQRYAQRTQRMTSSAIREILKLTQQPEVISFAGGLPAPEAFPVEDIERAASTVLKKYGTEALQYGLTEGYVPLRELLAARATRPGFKVSLDNVLITSGSQQALDLVGKIFVDAGDFILVETPTYLGALQAWNAYCAEYISAPSDNDGIIIDGLEEHLRMGPKFAYIIPTFQNPTGVTMSLERRRQLVSLMDKYGVPIVEDDPYGALRFEGEGLPSVIELDALYRQGKGEYDGNVIYMSTFSKILAPGLRLAWVIAPADVIRKLVQAKQGTDLHTPTFNQMVAYEVMKDGTIDRHLEIIQDIYYKRRDIMLETLEASCPECVEWTHPQGGLFLWVKLPEQYDANEVLKATVARKCAFVPGDPFHPNGSGRNTMRLNFSNSTPEQIRIGITCLGEILKDMIKE